MQRTGTVRGTPRRAGVAGDRSDNDEFRSLLDDVLAGRRSLTDASGTAVFSDVVFARVAREFDEYVEHLTEDEKQGLTAHAQEAQCAGAEAGSGGPCASCPGICALTGSKLTS